MSTVKTDSVIGSFLPIPVIEHATDSEVYTATAGQTVFITTKFDRSNAIRVIAKSSGGAFSDVPATWTATNTVTISGTILGAGQVVYIFKVGTHASKVRVQDATGAWVDLNSYVAAKAGANNDITALNALTTPITPAQGGVGTNYISGLVPSCEDGSTLVVTSGVAYIPSVGNTVSTTNLSLPLSGLTTGTWYHLYLYLNAGVPAIELVTTSPSAPYRGDARTKTGDTSRRLLGSFRSNTTGGLWPFYVTDSDTSIQYAVDWASAGFRVLAAGTASSRTAIDVSNVVPAIARVAYAALTFSGTTTGQVFSVAADGVSGSIVGVTVQPSGKMVVYIPTSSAQKLSYQWNVTPTGGNSAYVDIGGFRYAR